ncbi:MAG: HD domain-containing protein [Phycisphaerales bacterium]|nr:HD domain-containing protein [Phycisphaerales bacterium]
MTLAVPVVHPDQPGQDLLKRGYVLEQSVIARLRDLGVEAVYVDYPGLEDLDKHLAVNLSPERQNIYRQIKETIRANERNAKPTVSYTDYYAGTRQLVLTLMSQGQNPIYLDQMSRMSGDAIGHATAVAHLSLLLGIKLERYLIDQRQRLSPQHAREVVNLGVAGMLHDMGKLKLPEALRSYHGIDPPMDPAAAEEWEKHPRYSYELVHDGIEPSGASAVLHHHQHFDGTGFPITQHRDGTRSRLEGQKIHVFARILMAANLYDQLTISEQGQKRRSNLEILHLMRTTYRGWVDPEVLRILQAVCPPFPPGSMVQLSDGTRAVIVKVDGTKPYRPVVRRLSAEGAAPDDPINLWEDGAPAIQSIDNTATDQFLPAGV